MSADPYGNGPRVRAVRAHREVLLGALDGVELDPAGARLVDWLALWDDWTVTAAAMLIGAARAAGLVEDRA